MAVLAGIYGQKSESYVGCTLDTYEHNGYHDSYFYAVCWDDENGKIVEIEYDTTASGGGGYAKIDATDDVLRKVYRFYANVGRSIFDSKTNPAQAKEVRVGDTIKVVRGRKIPKGSVGDVFWVGKSYNQWSRMNEERVGVEISGERRFLPAEYVEVIGWEQRLITGRERRKRIRNFAINSMPSWSRKKFAN